MQIELAGKPDKKALKRFFKQQHYPASFIGFDKSYVIRDEQQAIIAAVIVSTLGDVEFLHGLCVVKGMRNRQLASQLLQYCCQQHPPIICFADESLTSLYLKNDFKPLKSEAINELLKTRWLSYCRKNPNLRAFIHS